ncbi:hypothetical protein CC1_20210 [Coprococcus catus GD/7]|uniref:Uncharacterized protein n=1 Tax=Coprococcus catus GD/7 TaxID=717962 RepID=D4J8S3_9FIRM|nr:hypothetical protein CC1_20210 [Coprococcus catus GD/7]
MKNRVCIFLCKCGFSFFFSSVIPEFGLYCFYIFLHPIADLLFTMGGNHIE